MSNYNEEIRVFCEGCGQMVYNIVVRETNVALCNVCLSEYEIFKLKFPKKTVNDFIRERKGDL